ncbi:MAG: hypothetical protein SGILL_008561 [Bacillariaceae sp.]
MDAQIEEEEYTSRVIQYFSTGLLTLPDGATLRSYLAEKLNCDPMRITKKFTGACCLGRRAYHLRDRPRASPAEMEVARLELQHLEQRFRLRVEHEQSGLPLPPRHEILAAQPAPGIPGMPGIPSLLASLQGGAPAPNPWLSSVAPPPGIYANAPGVAPSGNFFGAVAQSQTPFPGLAANPNSQLGQLLLQATQERVQQHNAAAPVAPPEPAQALNNLVASLLLAQAAGKLNQQQQQQSINVGVPAPPPSQMASPPPVSYCAAPAPFPASANPAFKFPIAAANGVPPAAPLQVAHAREQTQPAPQVAVQKQLAKAAAPVAGEKPVLTKEQRLKAAFEEQQKALRLAYEKSLREAQEEDRKSQAVSQAKQEPTKETAKQTTAPPKQGSTKPLTAAELLQRSYEAHLASLRKSDEEKASTVSSAASLPVTTPPKLSSGDGRAKAGGKKKQGKERDEEAGTILLGFLNSLRGSYEDAVGAKSSDGDLAATAAAAKKSEKKKKKSKKRSKFSSDDMGHASKKAALEPVSAVASTEGSSDSQEYPKPPAKSNRMDSLTRFTNNKRKNKPATVTEASSGTSSQPTTEQSSSSLEDSDSKSDKTEQNSSSSDEYENDDTLKLERSKGPPRKRLKGFHNSNEFTTANLLEHSKRMDIEADGSGSASDE